MNEPLGNMLTALNSKVKSFILFDGAASLRLGSASFSAEVFSSRAGTQILCLSKTWRPRGRLGSSARQAASLINNAGVSKTTIT